MPSNGRAGNLNGVAAVLLGMAVLSMFFLAFWLQKSGTRGRQPGAGVMATRSDSSGFAADDETDAAALEALIQGRKSAVGQISPGKADFMPADDISPRLISRDFHKLPDAYFFPQTPDTTRRAAARIRELQETGPQSGAARNAGKAGGNQ